ncbi:hypothetical protein BRADI_1g54507v3 [Brachypodium distachyon]|uniref:Uncharacterized protein n=1 Tax=Brachypodium distachyon TaxID=15368 RepID=A0A2K2DRE4_BRADI|nr:hypothetical protein BRADI_1g54507v3 [Brachypodium distachyon]
MKLVWMVASPIREDVQLFHGVVCCFGFTIRRGFITWDRQILKSAFDCLLLCLYTYGCMFGSTSVWLCHNTLFGLFGNSYVIIFWLCERTR